MVSPDFGPDVPSDTGGFPFPSWNPGTGFWPGTWNPMTDPRLGPLNPFNPLDPRFPGSGLPGRSGRRRSPQGQYSDESYTDHYADNDYSDSGYDDTEYHDFSGGYRDSVPTPTDRTSRGSLLSGTLPREGVEALSAKLETNSGPVRLVKVVLLHGTTSSLLEGDDDAGSGLFDDKGGEAAQESAGTGVLPRLLAAGWIMHAVLATTEQGVYLTLTRAAPV